jgi:hypothetical protein
MALTKLQRDALPASDFAVPGKRALPIHDATHTRLAWDMVNRTRGLTPDERKAARRRILERAGKLGIDTGNWQAEIGAGELGAVDFAAVSLDLPDLVSHPNRMEFTGVLAQVDRPSSYPPGGAGGRLVVMTRAAAEEALPSLIGMGVNYRPGFDGHLPQHKIGVVTEAMIEGDDILIAGHLYAADFPEIAANIRGLKDRLGFSFEASRVFVRDVDDDPLEITALTFTGAAVLLKEKAAYTETSLAARAEQEDEQMLEEIKAEVAGLGAKVAEMKAAIDQLTAATKPAEEDAKQDDPREAARERIRTILASEHVKGREEQAQYFALETEIPADQVIAALAKGPKPSGKLSDVMASQKQPNLGAGSDRETNEPPRMISTEDVYARRRAAMTAAAKP